MESWVSLVIALVSLAVAVLTWLKTHRRQVSDAAQAGLNELLKIALEYPELKDPEHCRSAVSSEDLAVRYRYDAYATLVWNYLEGLYQTYGSRRLKRGPFYGALKDLAERHKCWLFDSDRYKDYDAKLISFLHVQR